MPKKNSQKIMKNPTSNAFPTQGISISELPTIPSGSLTVSDIFPLENPSGTHSVSLEELKTFLFEELIGTIQSFSMASIPANYLVCEGQSVLIADYPKLYAKIGTIYGDNSADATKFFLPNFRGVFLRGFDPNGVHNVDKTALGVLQQHALQSHTHTVTAVSSKNSGDITEHSGSRYENGDFATTAPVGANIATETRPINYSIVFAIRAK